MARQSAFTTILKQHKRWADTLSVVSVVLVIGLLCVTAYLADIAKADEVSRIGMYIAMVGVVVVVCIWQAAAVIAASIELVLRRRSDENGPLE
jgi:uncharacterized membrane protein (DUF485 family)